MDPVRVPPKVARHHLLKASFETLSQGEGSREITREFWITEESRRLLLVSTLLTEIGADPTALGPLPAVDEVVRIMAEAQRTAPEAFRSLLLDPGVGSGCAYGLRRLHGGAQSPAPLWLDLGVVHALALAAAARAGLTWSTRLPLRDGNVMIYTYGLARFPDDAGPTVEARTEGGRLHFSVGGHELTVEGTEPDVEPAAGGIGWWGLRRIQVGADPALSVWLDDLDPLRDLADPVPPARLDAEAFVRWHRLIEDAWVLLCRDYRAAAEAMADGVVSIVPLKHLPGWDTRSASNGEAFGSVMLSEPPDSETMAISLIHEYQHIKLGALIHLIRLTEPDDGTLYYAPWRDDPRPLAGLVQGIYAFFGIAKFWRIRCGKVDGEAQAIAAFEYAYARQQTEESLRIALSAPGLTAEGRSLFEGLRCQVEEWARQPVDVDPRIAGLAELTADSHRIGWRLRHFRPLDAEVAVLADQLARDAPPIADLAPAVLRPHPDLRWHQRIPAVVRREARAVARPEAAVAPPGRDPVSTGENALLARDARGARDTFVDVLGQYVTPGADDRAVPDDEARAWIGLALSLAAEGEGAADILSRRPDLVRAVYAASATRRSATPVEVAEWLGPILVGADRAAS
jgi:HEXXH motif-containing protein